MKYVHLFHFEYLIHDMKYIILKLNFSILDNCP